ncbi:MAG: GNAT family N-acetyltransferase, partial [Suilimivivens sp.]
VLEEYRSKGVAKQLLDAMARRCMKEGKSYLGVDYETINPTALRFWTKYFEPYTYSFIRRIDERIYAWGNAD